ncbi:hypothetical protein ACFFX0_06875 [Citricoccus parietis]|uniref:Uncharacterized protein n=1 Tax=Citricoccus parietis TaxID=592307 RepID=A0ABV5FWA5_9MICC
MPARDSRACSRACASSPSGREASTRTSDGAVWCARRRKSTASASVR